MFTLSRTLPDGTEKAHTVQFRRVQDATRAAAHVLHDNRAATKADAQRFSVLLEKATLGEWLRHEDSGYAFRVDRV